MEKIILNKQQVAELVFENRYPVAGNKFLSRCIDGRYDRNIKHQTANSKYREIPLPALAIPGGDLGELALILATGNAFGFEVDGKRAFEALVEIVGGEENFHFHTDEHHFMSPNHMVSSDTESKAGPVPTFPPVGARFPKMPRMRAHGIPSSRATRLENSFENFSGLSLETLNGCGHWKQIQLDPAAYNLKNEDIKFINSILDTILLKIRPPVVLKKEHQEGAILIVKGGFGIYPHFLIETEKEVKEVEVFIYQQTLVNERHRLLVKKLIKKEAIKLYPGCDEEYLYQVLSDEMENHLFETLKRLAKQLPIFEIKLENDGGFKVEERGNIS